MRTNPLAYYSGTYDVFTVEPREGEPALANVRGRFARESDARAFAQTIGEATLIRPPCHVVTDAIAYLSAIIEGDYAEVEVID